MLKASTGYHFNAKRTQGDYGGWGNMLSDIPAPTGSKLLVGDAIVVTGDYEFPYRWLEGRDHATGEVEGWISRNSAPKIMCVVKLEDAISIRSIPESPKLNVGHFLYLSLRYEGDIWDETGVVNVCVFAEIPKTDDDELFRKAWVASHAQYFLRSFYDAEISSETPK